MRLSLFLIATLGLSACATQQDATPPANATPKADMGIENVPAAPATYVPAQPASACNADAAKDAMGKQATDDVLEKARIAAGASVARFLKPNMAITMEYRGDRLNLRTDSNDKVVGASCG
jgi:hypothetical protein